MARMTHSHKDIKVILTTARSQARTAVNTAMIEAYWLIGQRIVEEEQLGADKARYGNRLIEDLSTSLSEEFGKGFSYANLCNCRQFYLRFSQQEILYTVCRELSWSHLRLIMRQDNPRAIEFYCEEARNQNWSVRQLERNIKSLAFDRLLSSQTHEPLETDTSTSKQNHLNFIKDPYVLEFLQLPDPGPIKESQIEQAIIDELQKFLLEMGKGFSFVARQMRISTQTSHFFLDLVFYNYLLKCFVVIDLKTGQLSHQDVGQMDMYVRMFDDLKKGEDDNPTIGILCDSKDETIVKYSVLKESQQLFASKYRRILPTEEELIAEIEREKRLLESR